MNQPVSAVDGVNRRSWARAVGVKTVDDFADRFLRFDAIDKLNYSHDHSHIISSDP